VPAVTGRRRRCTDDASARPGPHASLEVKGSGPDAFTREGKGMTNRADSERRMNLARRWFTEG
jgi:hypothetical protein